jgi:hypothetical protein
MNSNMIIGKAKLPLVLNYAIDKYCFPVHIKSFFKKSGIVPRCPDAIDKTQLTPSLQMDPDTTTTGSSQTVGVAASLVTATPGSSLTVGDVAATPGSSLLNKQWICGVFLLSEINCKKERLLVRSQ